MGHMRLGRDRLKLEEKVPQDGYCSINMHTSLQNYTYMDTHDTNLHMLILMDPTPLQEMQKLHTHNILYNR